ncbi:MAG: hypothetical protein ACOC0C_03570 [Bacteroidota bacterium]
MKRIFSVLLSAMIVGGVFVSCEKNKENEAPVLPPENSMVMDFSDFSQQQKSTKSGEMILTNWGYAAFNVVFWNAVATVTSAVPVAAFTHSFEAEPSFLGDKVWEWSYSVPIGEHTYVSRLEGEVLTDSVEWRMYISLEGAEQAGEFLWFSGRSASDRSGGWWVLNENPQTPNAILNIEWENLGDEQGSLRYTYVKPGTEEYGNYIEFSREQTDDSPYDSFYTIFNQKENKNLLIEWNSETKEGRVKQYGEDIWGCWDTELADVACE